MANTSDVTIVARDGTELSATVFPGSERVVIVNAAMATPARFYRHLAAALQPEFTVLTWDYRDVGASRRGSLRGSSATLLDWATVDMPAIVDWADAVLGAEAIYFIGHSFGGQVAGMIDNPHKVSSMVTVSAQSGHWRLQGGRQRMVVAVNAYVTMPALTAIVGYFPWSRLVGGEDLPPQVAKRWAAWSRDPLYVLGDEQMPLDRYADFTAPVLAYSVDDDDWGTARSVDAMMSAYSSVERRHLVPADHGLDTIGHTGYFRPHAAGLWAEAIAWFNAHP